MKKERLGNWFRAGRWADLLEFALLAALAVALAQWTWIALTPPAVAESAPFGAGDPGYAGALVKRNLFGAGTPGLLPQREAAPASSFRLLGVVTPGSAGKGRAIFALEGGVRRVANVGELLTAGVVLKEVHPDHAVVMREGAVERIDLDRRAAAAISSRARHDAAR